MNLTSLNPESYMGTLNPFRFAKFTII